MLLAVCLCTPVPWLVGLSVCPSVCSSSVCMFAEFRQCLTACKGWQNGRLSKPMDMCHTMLHMLCCLVASWLCYAINFVAVLPSAACCSAALIRLSLQTLHSIVMWCASALLSFPIVQCSHKATAVCQDGMTQAGGSLCAMLCCTKP